LIILLTSTTIGGGIAAPLSVHLSAPILSEVTGITPDLVLEKPLYGGKSVAKYKIEKTPVVITIRRNYFEKDPLEGTSETLQLAIEKKAVTFIAEREEKTEGIPLEDAEVVVTGGRGIGSAENFSMLREIADLLEGAVGASRGAVDEGWMPPQLQVGQTGKIVAPTIYFAIGVSGASQHLAGITNAKCVIAINRDEEANIFKRARFGIVEDYKKVVPILIETIKKAK
jgi:electron transfer flavoprotein alpha subunit